MAIFSYKKVITLGPLGTTYTFIFPPVNADEEQPIKAIWQEGDKFYIDIPEGYQIPEQPKEIELQKDELPDSYLLNQLTQEQQDFDAQVSVLKDNLLTATLANNQEEVQEIKAQYQKLVGE